MKQTVKITVPDSWKDVTLKKYLALQHDLENYKDDEEAVTAFTLYHFCGITMEEFRTLSKQSYNSLLNVVTPFLQSTEHELQRFVTIDGVEYGFEPNLSNMAYGAYCDISKYGSVSIDKNWAKIMDILYRPVESKLKETYTIKPYEGKIDETKWLNVGMDVHFGTLFFFLYTLTDLSNYILNSSMSKTEELPLNILQTLERNGEAMHQLLNSPMGKLKE